MQPMKELAGATRERFEQAVMAGYEPVVLRGVAADWPLVAQARAGQEPCLQYLMGFDGGQAVDAVLARPDATRAFTYRPALDGFNFTRDKRPYAALFDQLWRYSHFPDPPAVAAQSALVAEALPGLERANAMALLDASIAPRIW
ncbi:MAG: cupin-like domain-containing protein, partial [Rubrivivax sp.]